MTTRISTIAFFYEQAGYSYDPSTETEEQGREVVQVRAIRGALLVSFPLIGE